MVSIWCASASLSIFGELGSNEMDNTVIADPLYDCQKRKNYEAKVCSKYFILICRGMLPLFITIAFVEEAALL